MTINISMEDISPRRRWRKVDRFLYFVGAYLLALGISFLYSLRSWFLLCRSPQFIWSRNLSFYSCIVFLQGSLTIASYHSNSQLLFPSSFFFRFRYFRTLQHCVLKISCRVIILFLVELETAPLKSKRRFSFFKGRFVACSESGSYSRDRNYSDNWRQSVAEETCANRFSSAVQ